MGKMSLEEIIRNAYEESENYSREGDSLKEVEAIQDYIRSSRKVYVPNKNGIKVDVLNSVLDEFNLSRAEILQIDTNFADVNRCPAIGKAHMALDQSDADLVIARGRLGVPGSGSLLVFMDNKSRILTAGSSASHALHDKSIEEAVYSEAVEALEKVGFKRIKKNI